MKTLACAAMAAVTLVSMMETANAAGKVGATVVNSCELTSPLKLTDSETAELARLGYRVNKKRSSYTRERFLETYEFLQMKEKKKETGALFLNIYVKPYDKEKFAHISKRELRLNLHKGGYDSLLAVGHSTPPKWARTTAEEKNADLTSFPPCID